MAINNLFDLSAVLRLDSKDFEEGLQRTEQQSSVFGDVLKANLVTKGIDVAIAGFKRLSGAAVGLAKESVAAFGNYEQLVGGIDTLFKESSQKVQENAANAFKTAGMSANDYMATTIQFSASLIQGLQGDTEKAAEFSNMAITDMSDNVNKMGTSMKSVQDAYRGLARQNFTMLDNLSIGYQGTAGEMARLINDSKVMGDTFTATAKNVKDISFDKYIEAIHVIQQQMGITGTTAAEAGETIQGSVGAVGAAWANLISGISNPKADLGKLIDQFIQSGKTALKNLIPTIRQSLEGIARLVQEVAPLIAAELPGFIDEVLPPLIQAGTTLVVAIVQNLPKILKTLFEALPKVMKSIGDALMEAWPGIASAFEGLLKTGVGKFIAVFGGLATAIKGFGIAKKIGDIFSSLKDLVGLMGGHPLLLAVGGLVTAFVALRDAFDKQLEAEYGLTEQQKKTVQAARDAAKAYDEMDSARKNSMAEITAEYGYIEGLIREYNGLLDSNGKVKKGYEGRAEFIKTTLAESFGIERDEIDKLIEKNGQFGESIDALLQKKKAEAILAANEQAYTESIQKRDEAMKNYQNSQRTYQEAEEKYRQTLESTREERAKISNEMLHAVGSLDQYHYRLSQLDVIEGKARQSMEEARQAVVDSEGAYVGYMSTLSNYEGLYEAILTGDSQAIDQWLSNMQNGFISAETGTKATLEKQLADYKQNYIDIQAAADAGMAGVTQKTVDEAWEMVRQSESALAEFKENHKSAMNALLQNVEETKDPFLEKTKALGGFYGKGIMSEENIASAKTATGQLVDASVKEAKRAESEFEGVGKSAGGGLVNGIMSMVGGAVQAVGSFIDTIVGAAKTKQKSNSPSKVWRDEVGKSAGEGYMVGLADMVKPAAKEAETFVNGVIDAAVNMSKDRRKDLFFGDIDFGEVVGMADDLADDFADAMDDGDLYQDQELQTVSTSVVGGDDEGRMFEVPRYNSPQYLNLTVELGGQKVKSVIYEMVQEESSRVGLKLVKGAMA